MYNTNTGETEYEIFGNSVTFAIFFIILKPTLKVKKKKKISVVDPIDADDVFQRPLS